MVDEPRKRKGGRPPAPYNAKLEKSRQRNAERQRTIRAALRQAAQLVDEVQSHEQPPNLDAGGQQAQAKITDIISSATYQPDEYTAPGTIGDFGLNIHIDDDEREPDEEIIERLQGIRVDEHTELYHAIIEDPPSADELDPIRPETLVKPLSTSNDRLDDGLGQDIEPEPQGSGFDETADSNDPQAQTPLVQRPRQTGAATALTSVEDTVSDSTHDDIARRRAVNTGGIPPQSVPRSRTDPVVITPRPAFDGHSVPITRPISPALEDGPTEADISPEEATAREREAERIEAVQYTVETLATMFTTGFQGCSDAAHLQSQNTHDAKVGQQTHNPLSAIPSFTDVPSAIRERGFRRDYSVIAESELRAAICGSSGIGVNPMHVCLHAETTMPQICSRKCDIDSFLGFAHSLAFARQGVDFTPTPTMMQGLKTDVHITAQATLTDDVGNQRRTYVNLKDIHHIYFGRVRGFCDISIHILFPHLAKDSRSFKRLTDQDLERWYDYILGPSIHECLPTDYFQHIVPDYKTALVDSRTRQTELRRAFTGSYEGQQLLHYHLQPQYLHRIWTLIMEKSLEDGVQDFRDPMIYFSAKGTKLLFKNDAGSSSMLSVMSKFNDAFSTQVDPVFIDNSRLYIDIAQEITANTPYPSVENTSSEPQVFCWKRCCLLSWVQKVYSDDIKPDAKVRQLYNQHFLHEACCMTSLPPKRSRLYAGGLRYSQFYNVEKEFWDKSKVFPFQNEDLDVLAVPEKLFTTASAHVHGRRPNYKAVEKAYLASKKRVKTVAVSSREISFGSRFEHRIAYSTYVALQEYLRAATSDVADDSPYLPICPSYLWAIRTSSFLDFIKASADRFAIVFEMLRIRNTALGNVMSFKDIQIMAAFLRCLRCFFTSGPIAAESALWFSKRQNARFTSYGLGFENTMKKYGFGWIEPRFDWAKFAFADKYVDNMLFGNQTLRSFKINTTYGDFDFPNTQRLDMALSALQVLQDQPSAQHQMLKWLTEIVFHQYRLDVLEEFARARPLDNPGEFPESWKHFNYAFFLNIARERRPFWAIRGNKGTTDWKEKPGNYVKFLFGMDRTLDTTVQGWRGKKPFRLLFHTAITELKRLAAANIDHCLLSDSFETMILRTFYKYHNFIPYTSTGRDTLIQTTKNRVRQDLIKQVMWFSVVSDIKMLNGTTVESFRFAPGTLAGPKYIPGGIKAINGPMFRSAKDAGDWIRLRSQQAEVMDAPPTRTFPAF